MTNSSSELGTGANSPTGQQAAVHQAIHDRLAQAERVLITAHIRPDGDAVGSVIGLGMALSEGGKTVRMVLADGVPQNLRHLTGSQLVRRSPGELSEYDTLIVVDCSDLQRTGGLLGERVPDINIDHHITNLGFAGINLVISEQVATAAIIAKFLPTWGFGYNKAVAEALLTGIVTDTIGFRTSNVTPEAMYLSAMLMEHGANLPVLYTQALVSKTYEAARYWGCGLGKLQQAVIGAPTTGLPTNEATPTDETQANQAGQNGGEPSGKITWTTLTLADRQTAGYTGNDDADLVNMLSAVEGDVTVIFVEQKNEHVKVSWRARTGIDVSQIALQFGGGGHAAASGADIQGSLEKVQAEVLKTTQETLVRQLSIKNSKG